MIDCAGLLRILETYLRKVRRNLNHDIGLTNFVSLSPLHDNQPSLT
jgi:hypothetical protein